MAKAAKRWPGDKVGNWQLEEQIGGGGNGVVWRVSRSGEPDRALKILRKLSQTTLARLGAEIEALKLAHEIAGIVPLIENELPRNSATGSRWFVMPLAQRAGTLLEGKKPGEVVSAFVPLAETLAALHALNIHHRDIKPSNLLALEGRLCLSDFGLVKYPSRKDITPLRGDIGPKFTMAPEMRREAFRANGGPADVYSFAKTLWIVLTGNAYGFDGQYSAEGALAIRLYHRYIFSAPIDKLLAECTDNDPNVRPTIAQVARRLAEWIALEDDFHRRNLSEWVEVQSRLFPFGSPTQATWTCVTEINSVIQIASQNQSVNHMFYPDGGGLSVNGSSLAGEPGFLRLHTGIPTIVKPRKLTYESFGVGSRWNYFRIECEEIDQSGTEGAHVGNDGFHEQVCELRPGEYVTPDAWEYGEFAGAPLPKGAGPALRYLKGALVIFSTRSPYNLDPATYDARHQKLGEEGFREYIRRQAKL